ncbi:MAG: ABC transporter substrate-binding protein [Bacteroidales bacterium]
MRIALRSLLLCFILAGIISCSPSDKKDKKETVTVATLRGPSAMSMIKIIDKLDSIEDKKIKFIIKNEPVQIRPLILQNKVDFAVVPTNMAAILYNKHNSYQVAAIPVWGTLYLFGTDSSIHQWEDLKEKKINLMAKGMTPDVMFRYLLIENDLNPGQDVDLDYAFPTHIELANAIASGKAELGVISEPLVSMVERKNPAVRSLLSLNDEWEKATGLKIPQTSLLVNQNFARKNNHWINDFLNEYNNSVTWVNANPEEAAQLIVKYNILENQQTAANAIPGCNMNFKEAGEVQNTINKYLEIFYNMNPDIIGGKIPDEKFVYKK